MSRIRYIKPSFFTDEDVANLSFPARLLFQGLWMLADREGRLEDRPTLIHVHVFPYDASISIDNLLDELAQQRSHSAGSFIRRYVVKGRNYIQIKNFSAHQRPHPKEPKSSLPPPPPESAMARRGKTRPSRGKTRPAVVEPGFKGTGMGMGTGTTTTPLTPRLRGESTGHEAPPLSGQNGPGPRADMLRAKERLEHQVELARLFAIDQKLAPTREHLRKFRAWFKSGATLALVQARIETGEHLVRRTADGGAYRPNVETPKRLSAEEQALLEGMGGDDPPEGRA